MSDTVEQRPLDRQVSSKPVAVERWISWEDAEGMKESFGGMGGFFSNGMRWADYLAAFKPEAHGYAEALRLAIIKDGIKATGAEHQSEELVPVFSDGTCATFSYRSWGDLMAAVWSDEDDTDYNYMHFYC